MRKGTSPGRSNTSAQQPFPKGTPGTNIGQGQELTDPRAQRHHYSGRTLALLSIGCIVFFVLIFATQALSPTNPQDEASSGLYTVLSTIGSLLLLVVIAPVLIADWRGFVTLNGQIKWRKMRGWLRVVVGFFFFGFSPFILPIYLFQAYQTHLFFKDQEPIERRRKIAEMEADLGFMPHAEGTCRSCKKPLQIGAEFCAYCGAAVIQKPRICSKCATTTFPDAKWCPKCHHPLDTSSQEAKKSDAPSQEPKKSNEPPQVYYL